MRSVFRLACLAAALAVGAPALAQNQTYTYPGLSWNFSGDSTSGFAGCTLLSLDATGAIYNSDHYTVYGHLFCPNLGGSYLANGNAYFDAARNFNMQVELGVAFKLLCTSLSGSTLGGTCSVYNNAGTRTGFAFIGLR